MKHPDVSDELKAKKYLPSSDCQQIVDTYTGQLAVVNYLITQSIPSDLLGKLLTQVSRKYKYKLSKSTTHRHIDSQSITI